MPFNGQAVLAWVVQFIAPELRPGEIVMTDNLSAHKVAGVRPDLEIAGVALPTAAQPGLQPYWTGVSLAQDAVAQPTDPNL